MPPLSPEFGGRVGGQGCFNLNGASPTIFRFMSLVIGRSVST